MINSSYLPPKLHKYRSKCHFLPVNKTRDDKYVCEGCRIELTTDTILHLMDKIPEIYYAK